MRLLLLLLLQLTTFAVWPSVADANEVDTTFLLKIQKQHFSQRVFIDDHKDSKYYKMLSSFEIVDDELELYRESIAKLSERFGKPDHFDHDLPDTKWIAAVIHEGKFYLYAPCDWLYHQPVMFTDSTIINWGEAPYPDLIRSVKHEGSKYTFVVHPSKTLWAQTEEKIEKETHTLHLIDKTRGVAILQTSSDSEPDDFHLFIAQSRAKEFPIIVNECLGEKAMEWELPNVDLRTLLK